MILAGNKEAKNQKAAENNRKTTNKAREARRIAQKHRHLVTTLYLDWLNTRQEQQLLLQLLDTSE